MPECQVLHVDEEVSWKLGFEDLSGRQAAGVGKCLSPAALPRTPKGSVDLQQMGQEMSLSASPEAPNCRPGSEPALKICWMASCGWNICSEQSAVETHEIDCLGWHQTDAVEALGGNHAYWVLPWVPSELPVHPQALPLTFLGFLPPFIKQDENTASWRNSNFSVNSYYAPI